MEQTALVHKLGSDKYGPYNWRKTGVCASTYVNAILRHLNAWRDGETLDPESGISHLAHVACSCNILLDADHCSTLQDDRNVKPPNTPARKMDMPTGAFVYPIAEPSVHTEGFVKSEGDFGYVSTFKIPIEFADEAEAVENSISYTEYRFLEVGELIQEGDQFYAQSIDHWFFTNIGHMSLHNTEACKYRRKVEPVEIPDEEPEQPVETGYRFLKAGERIQEGDQYYGGASNWCKTNHHLHEEYTAPYSNVYRRKDERKQDCTCGRIKINHHTLGWICEDCEWHGEPY